MTGAPVDLARVRAALAVLDDLVSRGAVDPDRTAAWLAGELEEGPMSESDPIVPTSLRLPRSMLERADELAASSEDGELAAIAGPRGVSRSVVLRWAVERGLAQLEERDGPLAVSDIHELRASLVATVARIDELISREGDR